MMAKEKVLWQRMQSDMEKLPACHCAAHPAAVVECSTGRVVSCKSMGRVVSCL